MDAGPAAFRATRRVTFALGLCLLAFVFAVEAKTACYGPPHGPGVVVQAAKAWPADLLRIIDHGVSVSPSLPQRVSFAVLAAVTPARSASRLYVPRYESGAGTVLASHLTLPHYFRPPPVDPLPSIAL
jgi:hypothetical protein